MLVDVRGRGEGTTLVGGEVLVGAVRHRARDTCAGFN